MGKLTFRGGIHPYEGKELSKDHPIEKYAFYYGKTKETCTSCTNDRRKTKHHPSAPGSIVVQLSRQKSKLFIMN